MIVISERAELHRVGVPACMAEVVVEDQSGETPVQYYVNACLFDGETYGVTKSSIFDDNDNTENAELLEEYMSIEETRKSSFAKYFDILARMIDELGN